MQRRVKVGTRVLAALAVAAACALPVAGCSPGADYPSLFPAVHDMPPPRNDTTLDPAQVQQATEDLITARDHLNAEAPASGQDKAAAGAKPGPKKKPAAAGASSPRAAAADRTTQTAGAEAKP